MKLVTAIIQPDKLPEVHESLVQEKIFRITVSRCTGHGQAKDEDLYRGQKIVPNLSTKVRLDIACNEEFVEPAIKAILKSAKHESGKLGDGKIFVTPLEECIRIRTGERGSQAI